MQVAVLGTGNGGVALSADLALRGHDVSLWGRTPERVRELLLDPSRSDGPTTITLRDAAGQRDADVRLVTSDLKAAIDGASLVVVPLPSYAQRDVAERLAPVVAPDQVVALVPGNLGSLEVQRVLRDGGVQPSVVETATLPFGARRAGAREVLVPVRAAHIPAAAVPGSSADAVAVLADAIPGVEPAADVLDVATLNLNAMIHPALTVTNAGAIEHFESYDIHAQGTTPSTLRLIYAADRERIAVREALGYGPPHYEQQTFYEADRAAEGMYEQAARGLVAESKLWKERHGLDYRYLTEDVPYGLAVVVAAGRAVDVPTPVCAAIATLASTLLGRDLDEEARTLESVGLGGLDARGIREALR